MKKYGLPSVETVAVKPTQASLRKALEKGGDHSLRLLRRAGLKIVGGKVVKETEHPRQ